MTVEATFSTQADNGVWGAMEPKKNQRKLYHLRSEPSSHPVLDEDLSRLSPLIFEHINMLGRYSFAVPEEVARGELRPLRNPDDDI